MPGFWREREGNVSIEATFFIIFFVIMFYSCFEIGRALAIKHSMDVGCYRAARFLSFSPGEVSAAEQMVREEVNNNLLGGGYGSQITVNISVGSSFQDPITVLASLDYQGSVPFLNLVPVTLQARHSMVVEAYP